MQHTCAAAVAHKETEDTWTGRTTAAGYRGKLYHYISVYKTLIKMFLPFILYEDTDDIISYENVDYMYLPVACCFFYSSYDRYVIPS